MKQLIVEIHYSGAELKPSEDYALSVWNDQRFMFPTDVPFLPEPGEPFSFCIDGQNPDSPRVDTTVTMRRTFYFKNGTSRIELHVREYRHADATLG